MREYLNSQAEEILKGRALLGTATSRPMSVHEIDQVCKTLVTKILSGQPLSVAEKARLTECAGCMLEVVRQLDQERVRNLPSHGTTGSAGETDAACSAEVIEALEHGRRAFAREFGLS